MRTQRRSRRSIQNISTVSNLNYCSGNRQLTVEMSASMFQSPLATIQSTRKHWNSTMARKDSLKEIREILIQRRDALRQAINGDDSLLRELSQQQGGDEVDFALDCAHGEINSQLAEVESRELNYIEYAIKRLDENTYGKCEACNRNIPMARLKALPYATFCIRCKIKAEKVGLEPGAVVDWASLLDGTDDMPMNSDFPVS